MKKLTLRTRIFLSYSIIIALALIVLNWVVISQLNSFAEDSFYGRFDLAILSIENEMWEQFEIDTVDEDALFPKVTNIARNLDVHITVLDATGEEVLFDTETEEVEELDPFEWEELFMLLNDGDTMGVDYEEQGRMYIAQYVWLEDEPEFIVRVGASFEALEQTIRNQTIGIITITAVFGLILLFVLGSWLANALTRPLTRLQLTAQTMATGDLSVRADTNEPKEIADLATDFNQMADAVEQMVAEQKAFANNAAHELRTPLTAIRIRTETLIEDETDDDLTQQYIVEIDDEAKRLSRLVDDLRILSRTDAQSLRVGDEQVDLGRLLNAIEQEFATAINAKRLNYTAVLPTQPATMQASVIHLRVLLRNLIENAIKYTPEFGSIQVILNQKENKIQIDIIDTGIGIPEKELSLIFNRFYRVDKAHNRKIPGSGLGLSLAKSIVDLYGGQIKIQSEGVGIGTAVTLILPINQ